MRGRGRVIALERGPLQDYYEILGVERNASAEEIRRAYRKKAREFHPDIAGADSEEKFKEVSAAYEVLSDPAKRERYDLGGYSPMGSGPMGGGGFSGESFGFGDIFESLFSPMGGFGTSGRGRGRPGSDVLLAVEVSLEDLVFGTTKEVVVDTTVTCETCEGSGAKPGTSPVTCSTCAGRGAVETVQQSLLGPMRMAVPCRDCGGSGQKIEEVCPECRGAENVHAKRRISVEVPAGAQDGSRIRLRGQGEAGTGGASAGDLYVEVREQPDPTFSRQGPDLHTSISVPMTTAALGTVFVLKTFDGEKEVEIPAGTQPTDQITLAGLGVPRLHSTNRGDLHVHVNVQTPTDLSDEERSLMEQLAKSRGEDRVEPQSRKSGGFFDRFRGKKAV